MTAHDPACELCAIARRRTDQLVAALETVLAGFPDDAAVYVYVHPHGELDARVALLGLPAGRRRPRLYMSPLVPPGEVHAQLEPIDDPQAREVRP